MEGPGNLFRAKLTPHNERSSRKEAQSPRKVRASCHILPQREGLDKFLVIAPTIEFSVRVTKRVKTANHTVHYAVIRGVRGDSEEIRQRSNGKKGTVGNINSCVSGL